MKKRFLYGLWLSICLGLTACQVEQKNVNNKTPNPNQFGLSISSMKSRNEIDTCLKEMLSKHHIKIKKNIEIFYSKHNVIEYHLKDYQEILRLADRKGKRQLFFTYDPQKDNHRIIFNIVIQCVS